jgi:hypothetical protein
MIGLKLGSGELKSRQRADEVGLQLDLVWRDEDLFDIHVSAWNGAFGGVAELYVVIGGLEELANKLSGFPRDPKDVREVVLGSFGREFAGGAASLRFYCADRAGHSYLESKIESESESAGVVQYAIISMPIEAAAIDSFVIDLRRLERERSGTAILQGRG